METTYQDRTDSFEQKLKLLKQAWTRKDLRLARALTASMRNTAIQAQHEQESIGEPLMPASRSFAVASLPAAWRDWARGWKCSGRQCEVLMQRLAQADASDPIAIKEGEINKGLKG